MTERSTREGRGRKPQGGAGTDLSRRHLTRLGIGGTPVLMTLASRPVLGANCLSNAISGNLSAPDRGLCEVGVPVYMLQGQDWWGPINAADTLLSDTNLVLLVSEFTAKELNKSLRHLMDNGTSRQQLILAAWYNAITGTNYMMTEAQLYDLVNGLLPIPGGDLEIYLASTLSA